MRKAPQAFALTTPLRPILESIDGFIDNERFESKRREGWVLSLSTWRDEKALVRWRSQGEHHRIQERGRNGIFSDYHLRVCEVTADSHPPKNLQVIEQRLDVSEIGKAKALAITEVSPAPGATFPTHPDLLPSHVGFDVEARWTPKSFAGVVELCHRRVRNVRDYGMFERREAAQYFPEVEKATQE